MAIYKEGDIIVGTVTGVEDYGIFLSFGNDCCGLVHISEISDSFVKNVSDYAHINDSVRAKVLSIDENGHYKLSIKDLEKTNKDCDAHIVETNSGFHNLREKLPEWIEEAYIDIEKK